MEGIQVTRCPICQNKGFIFEMNVCDKSEYNECNAITPYIEPGDGNIYYQTPIEVCEMCNGNGTISKDEFAAWEKSMLLDEEHEHVVRVAKSFVYVAGAVVALWLLLKYLA